jgi:16S rRNA (guanine966-N2)-methyltransferase
MRIIGGDWRGRPLEQPKTTATRPTSDKVRAALFDVLGDVHGLAMLDAYAGSGAIGIEALSRGASSVVAIETAHLAIQSIDRNTRSLAAGTFQLNSGKVEYFPGKPQQFDLIFADPPYADVNPVVLDYLARFLQDDGTFVVSHSSRIASPELQSLKLVRHKVYGDSALSFYQRT